MTELETEPNAENIFEDDSLTIERMETMREIVDLFNQDKYAELIHLTRTSGIKLSEAINEVYK